MANTEDHFLVKAWKAERDQNWKIETNSKLSSLLQKLPKRNHVTGFISGSIALELKAADGKKVKCGTLNQPNVDELMSHATPSSFGKGSETVYDETVRKGKELTAEQLRLSYERTYHRQSFEQCFLDDVKEKLPPGFIGKNFSLRFYKLALYEPGGHFDLHRDTVHDREHVATLLVEVNTRHTGGDLILEKDGIESKWSLSEPFTDPDGNHSVRWIMFYTDVQHRVEEVTSGVRMVLQFDVYDHSSGKDTEEEDEEEDEDEDEDEDRDTRVDIFECAKHLPENTTLELDAEIVLEITKYLQAALSESQVIAIPCYYLYTSQSLSPERLKSFDAQVFQALVERGFGVALVPAELSAITDYEGSFSGEYSERTMNIFDFPLTIHYYDGEVNGVKTTDLPAWPETLKLVYHASGMEQVLLVDHESYVEYTGNEAQPGIHRYLGGVMILFSLPLPK